MRILRIVVLFSLIILIPSLAGCREEPQYVFAVVGDFQQPDGNVKYRPASYKIIEEIVASKAEFVVILGDLVGGKDPRTWEEFDRLMQPLRDANKEIHAVIGNNDVVTKEQAAEWVKRFGERHRVLAKPGLYLGYLDTELDALSYRNYELGAEQIAWLKEKPWMKLNAGKDPLLFFFMHRPVWRSEYMKLDIHHRYGFDKPEIAALLEGFGADAVFSGHEHLYEEREREGTTYYISGGGGGELRVPTAYFHFLLVTVYPESHKYKVQVIKVEND